MLADFRKFIMRGNVLDLAVAVVIGVAFNAVVNSLVNDVIMQVVAAIFGKPNFDDVTITLRHDVGTDANGNSVDATLQIGTFINTLIALVLTGLVLFLMIKGYNSLKRRQAAEETGVPQPNEVELLIEIRDLLKSRD